jgi:predicted permease
MSSGYDTARARAFQDELLGRVRTLPGVRSAAYASTRPFTLVPYPNAPVATDAYRPAPDEQPIAEYNQVTEGWFATMGIPLLAGREFTRADDERGAPVAVVDETMATRFWPGRDALGSELLARGKRLRVVGIARATTLATMLEERKPFFYVPLRQEPATWVSLFVDTGLGAAALAPALARELHALDAGIAPGEVLTMREQVDRMSSAQSTAATLLAVFGTLALALASVGLYAVLSYAVSQSTRELGLRMALGASAGSVLSLVLGRGLALTAGGLALGTAAAIASTRLVTSLLYGVGPRDPAAFGGALAVMLLVSCAACLAPALRATRTDPVLALKQ